MLFTLPTCASEPRKLIKSAANFRGAYNLKKKDKKYFPPSIRSIFISIFPFKRSQPIT